MPFTYSPREALQEIFNLVEEKADCDCVGDPPRFIPNEWMQVLVLCEEGLASKHLEDKIDLLLLQQLVKDRLSTIKPRFYKEDVEPTKRIYEKLLQKISHILKQKS